MAWLLHVLAHAHADCVTLPMTADVAADEAVFHRLQMSVYLKSFSLGKNWRVWVKMVWPQGLGPALIVTP